MQTQAVQTQAPSYVSRPIKKARSVQLRAFSLLETTHSTRGCHRRDFRSLDEPAQPAEGWLKERGVLGVGVAEGAVNHLDEVQHAAVLGRLPIRWSRVARQSPLASRILSRAGGWRVAPARHRCFAPDDSLLAMGAEVAAAAAWTGDLMFRRAEFENACGGANSLPRSP